MAEYVNNKKLLEQIIEYGETGEISEDLHLSFYKMCKRNCTVSRFNNYTLEWKEDMVHESYLKCIKVIKKFDKSRTNPFAYFTTVIRRSYLDSIHKENIQKNIRENLTDIYKIENNIQGT